MVVLAQGAEDPYLAAVQDENLLEAATGWAVSDWKELNVARTVFAEGTWDGLVGNHPVADPRAQASACHQTSAPLTWGVRALAFPASAL